MNRQLAWTDCSHALPPVDTPVTVCLGAAEDGSPVYERAILRNLQLGKITVYGGYLWEILPDQEYLDLTDVKKWANPVEQDK